MSDDPKLMSLIAYPRRHRDGSPERMIGLCTDKAFCGLAIKLRQENEDQRQALNLIRQKFASGNDVPIERITLRRDEIAALLGV